MTHDGTKGEPNSLGHGGRGFSCWEENDPQTPSSPAQVCSQRPSSGSSHPRGSGGGVGKVGQTVTLPFPRRAHQGCGLGWGPRALLPGQAAAQNSCHCSVRPHPGRIPQSLAVPGQAPPPLWRGQTSYHPASFLGRWRL